MLSGHKITYDTRPATCCDEHTDEWVVCSCGWEYNGGHYGVTNGSLSRALVAHRLDSVERVIEGQERSRLVTAPGREAEEQRSAASRRWELIDVAERMDMLAITAPSERTWESLFKQLRHEIGEKIVTDNSQTDV